MQGFYHQQDQAVGTTAAKRVVSRLTLPLAACLGQFP